MSSNSVIDLPLSAKLISFVQTVCHETEQKEANMLFVRGHEMLPQVCGFDLDVLIDKEHIKILKEIFNNVAKDLGLWCCWKDLASGNAKAFIAEIGIKASKRMWLYFDFQLNLVISSSITFSIQEIPKQVKAFGDQLFLQVAEEEWYFLLLFLDSFRKSKLSHRPQLVVMLKDNRSLIQQLFEEKFPSLSFGLVEKAVDGTPDMEKICQTLNLQIAPPKSIPKVSLRKKVSSILFYYLFFLYKHKPMFFVISGPDGAGKTTAVEKVKEIIDQFPVPIKVFHHTTTWKQKKLETLKLEKEQSKNQPVQKVSFTRRCLKIIYRALPDFLQQLYLTGISELEYLKKVNLLIGDGFFSGKLILSDRYIYDRVVKMRLLGKKKKLQIKIADLFANYLLRRPKSVIILHDSPENIYYRKKELSIEEIGEYQAAFSKYCKKLAVDTEEVTVALNNPVNVGEQIIKVIFNKIGKNIFSCVGTWERNYRVN